MKTKKNLFIIIPGILLLTFFANTGSGLEVDVDEVRSAKPVKFINFQGEYDKKDPVEAIEGIGKYLSRNSVKKNKADYYLKYSIIRAISKEESDKFSADIFSIDKEAKVGHIDIIRRITAAYLMDKFGYSRKDAGALAVFITYYNAVYRGNIDYFSSKYKSIVMKHINKNNAGISTLYSDWAGATRMLVPLTEDAQKGKLDSISPDIITDKKTVKEMRRDNENIPARRDMADLKERILEKDKTQLEKQKQELDKKSEKIGDEKKKLAESKEEIRKREESVKKEKEGVKEPEKRKELEEKEKLLKQEKDQIRKKEAEIKEKDEEAKKEEKKIEEQEKKIESREEKLKEEKRDIERDELKRDIQQEPDKAKKALLEKQQELDEREDKLRDVAAEKNIYANKFYYLKIKEYLQGGHYNNEMYMIDAATKKVMFKSPVENICGSRYDIFSDGIAVITHRGNHKQGHMLTILDRDTLEAKATGEDNIFWRSFVEIRDGFIYVIVNDRGKFYLGRFDGNLHLRAKSTEEVDGDTFITFYENFIYVNRKDKTIIVLNKTDLSLVDEVKP